MAQLQQVKIFLASPSDVGTERRYVKAIVDELNIHIAPARKVVLTLVSSERVRPGIGRDGQTIVNNQIGRMSDYDIFIGIMWKRIGTRTPRARSGTVEEFNRAKASLKRNNTPLVWFFFRQPVTKFKSKEEETQQQDVLKFKERVRRVGVAKDYSSPADFRAQLREYLSGWLVNARRTRKRPQRRAPSEPVPAKEKTSIKRPKREDAKGVASPGQWIMLDDLFYKATFSRLRADQSIVLRIATTKGNEVTKLRSLSLKDQWQRKQVSFANNFEATIVDVLNVDVESTGRTTTFDIELKPVRKTQGRYLFDDDLAIAQARMLLLGDPLPKDRLFFMSTLYVARSHNQQDAVKGPILPALWSRLSSGPTSFLPKAWLVSAYYLKMSGLADEIQELRLGPIKNKMVDVFFRGTPSSNGSQSRIIEVRGTCKLVQE